MIFVTGSCVTFRGFLSTRCFHRCIRSSWLIIFSLAFTVLFSMLTSFIFCNAILDCLSSTESLILLICFCMYSVCSFRYMLAISLCFKFQGFDISCVSPIAFGSGFDVCTLFLITNVSHGTLILALCLVVMLLLSGHWRNSQIQHSE